MALVLSLLELLATESPCCTPQQQLVPGLGTDHSGLSLCPPGSCSVPSWAQTGKGSYCNSLELAPQKFKQTVFNPFLNPEGI